MRKSFVLLLTILMVGSSGYARTRQTVHRGNRQAAISMDNYHFGYLSVSGGYTSLSHTIPDVSVQGNWGALAGLGYEFRKSSFWISVGAQVMQEQSQMRVNEFSYIPSFKGVDDQQQPVDYYRYTIRQTDDNVWRTVDIPILLGYYNSGFYVGAGVKVGFAVGATTTTDARYDLSAKYTHHIGEFQEMNYYTNYNVGKIKYEPDMRPQFSVLGEIGYDVLSTLSTNSRVCHVLKLGFYFEYGVRNLRPDKAIDPIFIQGLSVEEAARTGADVRQATVNPYYCSSNVGGKWIVPYYVGLKLTYMIGGSRNATGTWHKGCQCYQ